MGAAAALGLLAAGASPAEAASRLPPFACTAPFTAAASHESLGRAFGGALTFRREPGPEGTHEMATVLFPRDRSRRAVVEWSDLARRRRPAAVRVGEGSRWRTPQGVSVGDSLSRVEAINGRPFNLAGFGWDYGGTVLDFDGGTLASTGCRLILRFSAHPDRPTAPELDGDRELKSDDPLVRAADPVVYEMILQWD